METISPARLPGRKREPQNDEAFKTTYEFTHSKTTDFKNGRGNSWNAE